MELTINPMIAIIYGGVFIIAMSLLIRDIKDKKK